MLITHVVDICVGIIDLHLSRGHYEFPEDPVIVSGLIVDVALVDTVAVGPCVVLSEVGYWNRMWIALKRNDLLPIRQKSLGSLSYKSGHVRERHVNDVLDLVRSSKVPGQDRPSLIDNMTIFSKLSY